MPRRLIIIVSAVAIGVCLAIPGEAADALRVCADPDNLPFSSSSPVERGLYVELAELVAARLGMRTEYTWWLTHYGKRAVRNTLLADRCDAFFALPDDTGFMGRSLSLTHPFLEVGYAVIGPASLSLASFDDLKARTVAVQFGTQPQIELATREGFRVVTFRLAEEALDALARREVDAAFLWGPTAGYYNQKKLGGAYRLVPVAGPGLQWRVAVGVRKGKDDLRTALNGALAQLAPDIVRLADTYGFPLPGLVKLDASPSAGVQAPPEQDRLGREANPFAGDPAAAARGKSLFNQHCSHCHAPNAMSPEPTRDLRRLKLRYGDRMRSTAYAAILEGRHAKGMPGWKDGLPTEAIWQILTFLESVQRDP